QARICCIFLPVIWIIPPACFFLLIRRLPTSTLFPYTTLFRSKLKLLQTRARRRSLTWGRHHSRQSTQAALRRAVPRASASRRRGDRKSTRLNSSHSQISYAVFCLKKKAFRSSRPPDCSAFPCG